VTRVDAHQHYWNLQRGDYAWLTAGEATLYRDFTPEDLSGQLADCAVGATVLVQAAATEAETRFLFGLARAHAVTCFSNLPPLFHLAPLASCMSAIRRSKRSAAGSNRFR